MVRSPRAPCAGTARMRRLMGRAFPACAGVLWTVAPSLVFFLLAYAAVGTVLTTTVFGKRLVQLQFMQLQREGDLRFDLVRTRENSGAPPSSHLPLCMPAPCLSPASHACTALSELQEVRCHVLVAWTCCASMCFQIHACT